MIGQPDQRENPATRASRAPVIVVVAGLGLALILVLLGASLAAAPAPPPLISRPGASGSPRAVTVILREYHFDPTPLYVVPGETVRLTVLNGGMIEHEFALGDAAFQDAWARADAEATPPAPFASAPPASVTPSVSGVRLVLASGEQAVIEYRVPDAGGLQLICHLPEHAERGMVGEVVETQP